MKLIFHKYVILFVLSTVSDMSLTECMCNDIQNNISTLQVWFPYFLHHMTCFECELYMYILSVHVYVHVHIYYLLCLERKISKYTSNTTESDWTKSQFNQISKVWDNCQVPYWMIYPVSRNLYLCNSWFITFIRHWMFS